MKKPPITCGIILMLILFTSVLRAQQYPTVVNASGGHYSNTSVQLDYSVGEVSVKSFSSATNLITVGFLQPDFVAPPPLLGQTEFTGYKDVSQVNLNWNTPVKINHDHFDIERSADGVTFLKLLSMVANNADFTAQNYKAVDPAPFEGITYYRLKQTDNDSSFSYSKAIAIVTANNDALKFVVWPNPFAGSINIMSSTQKPYSVKIFDMSGRMVSQNTYTGKQTSVNLSALSSGMYLLQLYTKKGDFIQSVKITKQ